MVIFLHFCSFGGEAKSIPLERTWHNVVGGWTSQVKEHLRQLGSFLPKLRVTRVNLTWLAGKSAILMVVTMKHGDNPFAMLVFSRRVMFETAKSESFHMVGLHNFFQASWIVVKPIEPRKKTLRSIEFWLFNRDPYNGFLWTHIYIYIYSWVVFHPQKIPSNFQVFCTALKGNLPASKNTKEQQKLQKSQ